MQLDISETKTTTNLHQGAKVLLQTNKSFPCLNKTTLMISKTAKSRNIYCEPKSEVYAVV